MRRIALVTEFFHPTIGGTQTAVTEIAERLSQRECEVTVFAPLYESERPEQPSDNFETQWIWAGRKRLISHLIIQLRIFGKLAPFDLIHLFHPSFGTGALMARLLWRKPLIVSMMGYDTYDFHAMRMPRRLITRAVARAADRLTANSVDLARKAKEIGLPEKVEVVHLGVAPLTSKKERTRELRHTLVTNTEQMVCVAVQRLSRIKQPTVFLEAWHRLGRPDCQLILVGGGEMAHDLRRLKSDLHLENVTLTGEVSYRDVPNYLALADIFLHHSHYESFGLGILEAMSLGLPVIASNVGAVPEIVEEGVDGILIAPADPEAMAKAIERLIDSPELRQKLAAAALEKSRKFTWDRVADRFLASYEQVLEGE